MKLKIWPFSISVGIVTGVLFAICAFFVALAPDATAAFFGYLFHIDLSGLTRPISLGNFFAGLLGSSIGMAFSAAVVAWIYNKML